MFSASIILTIYNDTGHIFSEIHIRSIPFWGVELRHRKVPEFGDFVESMPRFKVAPAQLNKMVPSGIMIAVYLLQFYKNTVNFLLQVILKLILLKWGCNLSSCSKDPSVYFIVPRGLFRSPYQTFFFFKSFDSLISDSSQEMSLMFCSGLAHTRHDTFVLSLSTLNNGKELSHHKTGQLRCVPEGLVARRRTV